MSRPDTVPDVVDAVRRSRLIADAQLTRFLDLLGNAGLGTLHPVAPSVCSAAEHRLTPSGVLCLMVEQGLLTRYQATELAAGRTEFRVADYQIVDLLGRGGTGEVFLAEHPRFRERVALKVLSHGIHPDEAIRGRFLREARAAAALDHPNIVRVLDVNATHNPPFLVMEYVDGISLQAAVARYGTFSAGEAAAIGVQVAWGLGQAGAVGIVHRDIKPANLLTDRLGGIKILDLGIARFTDDPNSRRMTVAHVLGTLDYLAPEQAVDSSAVDGRADLYSLGATLYFLLAGHPPHPDGDITSKILAKQSVDPPPIQTLRPDVPMGLSEAISRLLARCPSQRFQSADEAAFALTTWSDTGPDFPARLFRPWRPTGTESPGQPTASDDDPSPTSQPPTRSLHRNLTQRQLPVSRATLEENAGPARFSPETPPPNLVENLSTSKYPPDQPTNEMGTPTEVIFGRCPKPRRTNWWWVAIALLALAATVLLLRW